MVLTESEYEEWKRNGWLNKNACKQFHTGNGCPHGISIDNPKSTEPCKTCIVRKY